MTRSEFGSITRLDKNRWKIRWSETVDGQRVQRSRNVRGSRREAERALARIAADSGRRVPQPTMTLAEYWPEYRADIERLAPQTRDGYERAWNTYVEPLFGDCVMEQLTSREVRRRLLTLDAPGAQRNAYKLLRQMYNAANADDLVENMPIKKHMRLDEQHKRDTPTFTLEDVTRFVDAIHGTDAEAIALVQLFGGLRREEATGLRWTDFRFENVSTLHGETTTAYIAVQRTAQLIQGEVVIGAPKTHRSERTVIITGYPAERLAHIAGEGWLNGGNKPGNPETYASRLATICRNADLPHMTPTGLRATFSTIHQQLGTPDTLVSMMMGHTQISTRYRHYLSANEDAMKRAASALSGAVG